MSNNIKDFKSMADEVMSDITVSDELKRKTLMRCVKKSHVPISKYLVPAACFALILGTVSIYSLLSQKTHTGEDGNQQINLMAGSAEGAETLPGQEFSTLKEWMFSTPEEAEKIFGSTFMAPSYIPENFKLDRIYASGMEEHSATKAVYTYFCKDQSFLIIEEKTELQNGFVNFESIDIHGTTGYLKANVPDNESTDSLDTELHWFKDGVHYSVMGQITKNEAMKVAMSMK